MYLVTGGAGFIGSEIVKALNQQGRDDIIVVDHIGAGDERYKNLCDCVIADYFDKHEFRTKLSNGKLPMKFSAILHQGACADTMETDGAYMLDNNFTFSKELLTLAMEQNIPIIYASSAAVYGVGTQFDENPENELPLNVYGYSKLLFDQYVRQIIHNAPITIVGLRYFNVYGRRERWKGKMASMVYQLYQQLKATGKARLFEGTDGYSDGEQRRDFVYVNDVVKVNLHLAEQKNAKGIVNVGTGVSRSFNDIANIIIRLLGRGAIEYVPLPDSLRGKYQSFTEGNIQRLRALGYTDEFAKLEDGIAQCVAYWDSELIH